MLSTPIKTWVGAAALGLLALTADRAGASPVAYTVKVVGSGSLGNTPFNNELITITATADTNNVMYLNHVVPIVTNATATVTVRGIGGGTFPDGTTSTVDTPYHSWAGIVSNTENLDFILGAENPAFATYNLKSSIGPLSGTPLFSPPVSFETTAGELNILYTTGKATFHAHVSTGAAPEPATLGGAGLAALAGLAYAWRLRAGGRGKVLRARSARPGP
jgi:hypothetical protein